MEIASHAFKHESLGRIPEKDMKQSIDSDISALEKLTGFRIVGHAYVKGSTSPATQEYLKNKGILYARGVYPNSYSFKFPAESQMLKFSPTCATIDKKVFAMIQQFIETKAEKDDLLLYLWGHSYEFDFHSGNGNWEHIEKVFDTLVELRDLIFCTNAEAFMHI